jgi:multiple sugar transport system permease protein
MTSFKPRLLVLTRPPTFVFPPTLENYELLFVERAGTLRQVPFHRYFVNSIVVTLATTVFSVGFACLAAYSLARLRPRGAQQISLLILGVRMLPPIVLVVPIFILYTRFGLLDTRLGLILPYTALNIPLATWMLQSFFLDLPKELEDAAMVDGCTRLGAFWRVILPLAGPGLAATAVFSFILAWNDLLFALPLTTSKAVTLPVIAARVRVEEGILWGRLGAITSILIFPVVVFTLLVQRYIVRGLTAGAIK